MAKDYGEMEREFIASLKDDTGRDLTEWVAAIEAQNFSDKNDAIDWLRGHGFPFNRASWLERIHANGGRLLYADRPATVVARKSPAAAPPAPPAKEAPPAPKSPTPEVSAREVAPSAPAPHDAHLESLIAAAKGYQPLYRMLAAEVSKALPGVRLSAAATYISVSRPTEFAAIEPGPRGLRIALDLGDRPFEPPLQAAKLTGAPKRLGHMILLSDARKVDARLMELIKAADARVNA